MMPSLRIHFTADDLARTRLAPGPDPLWELVLSLALLRDRHVPARYAAWQRAARSQLSTEPRSPHLRTLAALIPPIGDFPDFLTPAAAGADFGTLLDRVDATPANRLRADLGGVFGRRPAPSWIRDLAAGARAPMRSLTNALRAYYDRLLVPYRQHINGAVQSERALRARHVLDGGTEELLATLPAPMQWAGRTLRSAYACDRDIFLNGAGITLIPSYFCHRHPVTLIDTELPPVLVYPALDEKVITEPEVSGALAALLGETRAAALTALRIPCNTSELAERLHTSLGTASRHATALRNAGLLTTTRNGAAVLHALTPIGSGLLAR